MMNDSSFFVPEVVTQDMIWDMKKKGLYVEARSLRDAYLKNKKEQKLLFLRDEQRKYVKIWRHRKMMEKMIEFDAKKLYGAVAGVSDYITEARLKFENGVMSMICIDPANVCLVKRSVPYVGDLNNFVIVLNFSQFAHKLKYLSSRAKMIVTRQCVIISDDWYSFKLKTSEISGGEPRIPVMKFYSEIRISKDVFKKCISHADEVSDSIVFEVVKGGFFARASNDDDTESYFTCALPLLEGSVLVDCKARFSVEYLKKNFASGEKLVLNLRTDYPLVITDENDSYFCLAPRIDSKDCF